MALPLLTLPAELQALFAQLLVDATTAGRLAQASRACQRVLLQRLVQLREERRCKSVPSVSFGLRRASVLQLYQTFSNSVRSPRVL